MYCLINADQREEAQLQADLIRVQKQRADANRRIQTEITTANNKVQADLKAQQQAEFNLALFREEQGLKDIEGIQERANAEIEVEKFKLEQLLMNEELTEVERQLLKEQSLARQIEIQEKADAEFDKLREKETKQISEEEKKRESIRKQRLQDGLNLTKSAVELAGKIVGEETKAGKFLAIAAAGINTAQAVTKTLATGGALAIPQAAVVGGLGAAQIAKIKSTDVSGGSGGGSTPNVSTPTIPNTPQQVDTSNVDNQVNQQEALINALESQRFEVSVSEINDVQNAVSVSENDSTI